MSRLDRVRGAGAPRSVVAAAAITLSLGVIAAVSWFGLLVDAGAEAPRSFKPASEQTSETPKAPRHRRLRNRQSNRPLPTSAIPVDTVLPPELIQQRHPILPLPDVRRDPRARYSEPTPGLPVQRGRGPVQPTQ